MTLEEIQAAVRSGGIVHWSNDGYRAIEDSIGQWLIVYVDGSAIGLTWRDGVTLNGKPDDFYVVA